MFYNRTSFEFAVVVLYRWGFKFVKIFVRFEVFIFFIAFIFGMERLMYFDLDIDAALYTLFSKLFLFFFY